MAHLLLIDDDPAVIPGQVRQAFPAPEHRVEVATTGAEGLGRIGAGPPDVILLDLKLPDANGLDLLPQIKKTWPDTEVIVLTGEATFEAAVQAHLKKTGQIPADEPGEEEAA